jgi:heme-degrading monooxygenase HmoA
MIEVLFIAKIKNLTPEYEEYNNTLYDIAKNMNGFIGITSEIVDEIEITVSKWKTKKDIDIWAKDPEHMKAKSRVKEWYDWYRTMYFEKCK